MTRLHSWDIDPVNADADGIAAAQAVAAAGNLTLNGALISGGVYTAADGTGIARQISVTSTGDDSARTLMVTGTDADGRAQTEAIAGPNTTTESAKYWATVTQIAVDDGTVGNISAGIVDELCTNTFPLNRYSHTGALVQLDVTGTIDVTVQGTAQNIQQTFTDQESIAWISVQDTDLVGATADAWGNLDVGTTAMRVVINSLTDTAEVQVYVSEVDEQ
jgi:hypothetical protein